MRRIALQYHHATQPARATEPEQCRGAEMKWAARCCNTRRPGTTTLTRRTSPSWGRSSLPEPSPRVLPIHEEWGRRLPRGAGLFTSAVDGASGDERVQEDHHPL